MNATSNFSRERRPSIPPNSSTTGDHGIEKKADAKPTRIFRPSSLSSAVGMHSDAASQGGGWLWRGVLRLRVGQQLGLDM